MGYPRGPPEKDGHASKLYDIIVVMTFNVTGSCSLPTPFPYKIRNSKEMTLILVKADGSVSIVVDGRADKDALVARYDNGDILLMAWTGQWSTNIFLLTRADIDNHYR